MATEELRLIVRQSGAQAAAAGIRKVGTSATTAGAAVRTLRTALLGLGIGVGLRELKDTVDTFIQIENRINLVTSSTQEFNSVYSQLLNVSQETRASFEATTELYRRLAINTKDLGFSQERLIGLLKTINQSVVVSGATAKEARSGLIQLSQGFASGQLRGEEFRSVAEQLPGLLIAIADGMGKTIGQLREFAFAGKLTAVAVAEAIESQAAAIDALFQEITPTIDQAATQIGNAFIDIVGKINKATEGSKLFRDGMTFLRNNLEDVITGLFSAAIAYGAYRTAAWLAVAATAALKASIRSLLISTGIGALVVALGVAIDLLISFGINTKEIEGVSVTGFARIEAAVRAALSTIGRLADMAGITASFRAAWVATGRFFSALWERTVGAAIGDFKDFVQNSIDEGNKIIGFFVALPDAIKLVMEELPTYFKDLGVRLGNALGEFLIVTFNYWTAKINETLRAIPFTDFQIPELTFTPAVGPQDSSSAGEIADQVKAIFSEAMGEDYIGPFLGEMAAGLEQLALLTKGIFSEEYQKELNKIIESLKKAEAERARAEAARKELLESLKKEKAAEEESAAAAIKRKAALNQLLNLHNSLSVTLKKQIDPLEGQLEKLRQQEKKALELGKIAGVSLAANLAYWDVRELIRRTDEEIASLAREQGQLEQDLAATINEVAKSSPEFAQEMRDARDAIFEQNLGLEATNKALEALNKKGAGYIDKLAKQAERAAEQFANDLASKVSDAFQKAIKGEGFDVMEIFANKSAELFEKAMAATFKSLAESFQKLLKKVTDRIAEGGGALSKLDLGAGLGALVGVGGLLLTAAMQKGSQQVENELAAESIVTDVRDVRGVVAGPTNIPIFQIGAELESALNSTNAILIDILAAVSRGGTVGAAGAASVEDEAAALLNATSPSLI